MEKKYLAKITLIPFSLEQIGFKEKCQYEKIEDDWYISLDNPNKALLLSLWNSVRELDEMCQQLVTQLFNVEPNEEEKINV